VKWKEPRHLQPQAEKSLNNSTAPVETLVEGREVCHGENRPTGSSWLARHDPTVVAGPGEDDLSWEEDGGYHCNSISGVKGGPVFPGVKKRLGLARSATWREGKGSLRGKWGACFTGR